MVHYTVRPISDRTMFKGKHRLSPFEASWSSTEDLLQRELRALSARNVALEMDVTEADIRNDGKIRASARPSSSAVRLAFDSQHGPLVYATDRFFGWQSNVRAIALGMEALRRIERYGIANRDEQYAGFKQLPSGRPTPSSRMTSEEAYDVLAEVLAIDIAHTQDSDEDLVKRARFRTHPDRHEGDREDWDRVEAAAAGLGVLA